MYESLGNTLILTAGITWSLELIPQIIELYKTKTSAGVSLIFFWMTLAAYILYTIGNVFLQNWIVVLSHIPSTILTMFILRLLYKYRN